ncbi:MAG: PEP-CTERM sorting domain-containing protein [Pseudomonadota bacterium]
MFNASLKIAALAAAATLAVPAWAATEYLSFTTSNVITLPSGKATGTAGGKDGCLIGTCPERLTFNTTTGGKLTVTAEDNLLLDKMAYVQQSSLKNSGLGVLTGTWLGGAADLNPSVSAPAENLVLTFSKSVTLTSLWFFPDDRFKGSLTGPNGELDAFDEFTISVDGGPAQRALFGLQNGQPRILGANGLQGTTFRIGFSPASPESFYLAAIGIAPIPEPGTYALVGLGLAGAAWVARRRRG